jgi:hypothetical protein
MPPNEHIYMNPLDFYGCSITLAAQANQASQNDDDGAFFSERTTRRTMDSGKT